MQSEDQKQKMKMITMQALSRLEQLKLDDPPLSSPAGGKDLLSQLDNLPSPPSEQPRGGGGGGGGEARKAGTMPRGIVYTM